ncbi:hypothetical protein AKJ65_00960 [candidate division MSBL1 archaeon SCGC-AAA259E19]|uniref:Ribonuclease P protein component 4 n=1 Tax=candidate division MSBL1 archaeon SCGC-AAA259E19 TaxID=1698264 RepID=A0A133UNI8_9EURY|nr:hypothetical protein AKJ65_00960 [candidate division MSBL1 archaeon SCGC-AAA259E19]
MGKMAGRSDLKKIALERVERLLDFASSVFKRRPDLAHRYAELAWKIKTRYNLRLPRRFKRKFCRKCQSFWAPGETCRVRLRPSSPPHLAITCLKCGYVQRIPYKE